MIQKYIYSLCKCILTCWYTEILTDMSLSVFTVLRWVEEVQLWGTTSPPKDDVPRYS